jgi:hypothetical protein
MVDPLYPTENIRCCGPWPPIRPMFSGTHRPHYFRLNSRSASPARQRSRRGFHYNTSTPRVEHLNAPTFGPTSPKVVVSASSSQLPSIGSNYGVVVPENYLEPLRPWLRRSNIYSSESFDFCNLDLLRSSCTTPERVTSMFDSLIPIFVICATWSQHPSCVASPPPPFYAHTSFSQLELLKFLVISPSLPPAPKAK